MANFGITWKQSAAVITLIMGWMLASPASGVTVNVDFNTTDSTLTYIGQGAAPDPGTFWNGTVIATGGFTSAPLTASDGATSTPITFTLNTPLRWLDGTFPPAFTQAAPLFRDFAYSTNSGTITFSINNLDDGYKYDLYLYSQNSGVGNEAAQFTIGSEVKTAALPGNATSFQENKNYVKFSNLTPTGGVISGSLQDTSGGNTTFNGFQLVTVIPEPGSALFVGLGMIALLRRRFRSM